MAKLYFRYSAMGAGKSLDLLKVAYNYDERGMKTLIFNADLDTRFGSGVVASRTGIKKKGMSFSPETDFLKVFEEKGINSDGSTVHCILVDEAQFLLKHQVHQLIKILDNYNLPVICYGLRTDFMANLFEGSKWLLALADSIEELKTICWCGQKATMNARVIDGKVVKKGEQIQIGGNESYIALCRRHFNKAVTGPE